MSLGEKLKAKVMKWEGWRMGEVKGKLQEVVGNDSKRKAGPTHVALRNTTHHSGLIWTKCQKCQIYEVSVQTALP